MSTEQQSTTTAWGARYADSLMNTFGPPKTTLVRGSGARVWDADGTEYVDFLGGIAVNTLGHAHPALVRAVADQAASLVHVSNFFATPPQVRLAELLLGLLGTDGRVFFANSGTEANEAAFKLTRRTGRTRVVVAEGGFHGRTMGALALTSKEAYRTPFAPLPGDVTFVPYGDVDALRAAVDGTVAAVLLEPVQGEAGVVVPPRNYLVQAQQVAHDAGALLWLDEVQTGIGRTGTWFAHQNPELVDGTVVPDVVTLAKGLAGGVPIGACIATGGSGKLFDPGNHGTTFGGNPLAAAAALAVLDTVANDGLLDHSRAVGARLREVLAADDRVVEVRGTGLMVGLSLSAAVAPEAVVAGQDAGLILNATGPDRMRFVPPLVTTDADVDVLAGAWSGVLDAAYAQGGDR